MRRTGIDLSATRCLVVDAERLRRHDGGEILTRVHNFSLLPGAGSEHHLLAAELAALLEREKFPRRAWVNLWGVRNTHEYLLLPVAPTPNLEATVRDRAATRLGLDPGSLLVSTTLGSTCGDASRPKREVCYFAAAAADVEQRLRPITDAGFVVEGVTTPCGALWSHARLRRSLPGEVHAHVAIGVTSSSVAIFSGGSFLYGRDLGFGFCVPQSSGLVALERDELAARLAQELRWSFLYLRQYWEQDVSQVVLCGDMPELRSLTGPLIESLNLEVETMDTLEGFDPSLIPPAFAERTAAFRLASAIAVESPPVKLMPVEVNVEAATWNRTRVLAASAAAVVLAALLFGAYENQTRSDDFTAAPATRSRSVELPRETVAATAPEVIEAVGAPPQITGRSGRAPVAPRPLSQPPRATSTSGQPAPAAEHVVSSILFSSERRVALVDGRVVAVGDRVGSSVVLGIEPRAVVLGAEDGTRRRLEITAPLDPLVLR